MARHKDYIVREPSTHLTMPDTPTNFVANFDPATEDEWLAAVDKALKGADFDKKLVRSTPEGLRIRPLYRGDDADAAPAQSAPGAAPFTRGSRPDGGWELRQEITAPAIETVRERVSEELNKGGDSVLVRLDRAFSNARDPDQSDHTGVGGLSVTAAYDLARALGEIDLSTATIALDGGTNVLGALGMLVAVAARERVDPASLRASVGADPADQLATNGECGIDAYAHIAAATHWARAHAPNVRTWVASSRGVHAAGADAATELGVTIASAIETLRRLAEAGVSAEVAAKHVEFRFHTGSDLFMEVAKLRAARALWTRVLELCGAPAEAAVDLHIHTAGSPRTRSSRDPWVNMLRGTSETFSAIVGGAESIATTPFDESIGQPDKLARRVARNTQLVLRLESHLAAVTDPAGGSWYVERLTADIADKAWAVMQSIEAEGGLIKALESGFVWSTVTSVLTDREASINKRKSALTGVSSYANPLEEALTRPSFDQSEFSSKRSAAAPKERAAFAGGVDSSAAPSTEAFASAVIQAFSSGATVGQVGSVYAAKTWTGAPLASVRDSEGFEALVARTVALPTRSVFIAAVGPLASHKARASWVESFFGAGGLTRVGAPAYATAAEALSDYDSALSPVAIIVAADSAYGELVTDLAPALRAAGAKRVLLAGRINDEAITSLVDDCVFAGCDVLECLEQTISSMEAGQ
ncbi:MAG: methylmalonyl-CoA mutase [Bradymonadia bacterium]|jgi:methylmalonyl-CoA mutase